ncbi:MAG: aldo/keto reductase [Candidatus Omnitrophica bacterium]|nr:aldo/keto reductase [Candidatus Omnitrophota bacterium]
MIKGCASPQGTKSYKERFKGKLAEGHFREKEGLWFSSVGMGSYLGDPDDATDRLYQEALKEAIRSGVNVIDSAINYRCQRSERSFGKALQELIEEGEIKREEIIVCTKGGFIPFDGEYPINPPSYFQKTYLNTGILKMEDVIQGCHAMTPQYLEDQLNRSLANWGLETIDIYYVHNPETQLAEVDRKEFSKRLQASFEFLEKKVSEGKIQMYGTATWSGYRSGLNSQEHLSLEEINILAREVGGANHHFKVIQLPVNLTMPEAWVLQNQRYGAGVISFLEIAQKLGMIVIASASLLQGQLTRPFPTPLQNLFPNLKKPSQCSLQFVRSLSGMTTALVGMKQREHVLENLGVAQVSPFTETELSQLFQKKG